MKASISAPSPPPQTTEEIMRRLRGDSGSSGFVEGVDVDLHKYGLAATTFTGEGRRRGSSNISVQEGEGGVTSPHGNSRATKINLDTKFHSIAVFNLILKSPKF
jgi:hypothetical protein